MPASSTLRLCEQVLFLQGRSSRACGSDSPVTVALFTRTPKASMQAAVGRDVVAVVQQDHVAGHQLLGRDLLATLPSRSTLTWWGSSFCSAAMACSARYSCQNENRPLQRITPRMAKPSVAMPAPGSCHSARKASPAASQRIRAKKWVKPFRKRTSNGVPEPVPRGWDRTRASAVGLFSGKPC